MLVLTAEVGEAIVFKGLLRLKVASIDNENIRFELQVPTVTVEISGKPELEICGRADRFSIEDGDQFFINDANDRIPVIVRIAGSAKVEFSVDARRDVAVDRESVHVRKLQERSYSRHLRRSGNAPILRKSQLI